MARQKNTQQKPNPLFCSPREDTNIPPWILPSYKRICNEISDLQRFIQDKSAAVKDLLNHERLGTFPKWFPRTTYRPKPSTKFPSNSVDWDKFNLDHDKSALRNIILQYKAELEEGKKGKAAQYWTTMLVNECEAIALYVFGNMKEDGSKEIPPELQEKLKKEVHDAKVALTEHMNQKVYNSRLAQLEQERKKAIIQERELNAQDRMDTELSAPDLKKLVAELVDLKIKKMNLSKPAPPKKNGPKNQKKPAQKQPAQKQAENPKPKHKTNPAKGKGKPSSSKNFNKSNSNYFDYSKNLERITLRYQNAKLVSKKEEPVARNSGSRLIL